MTKAQPFHLAIPVIDLPKMRDFYTSLFRCETGRTDTKWVDLNFYGHQLVLHQVDALQNRGGANEVDGKRVRVPHFGVVLAWDDWQDLADRLQKLKTPFIVEPYIRFEGMVGEQATMFLEDPEGNALEFKAFRNPNQLFAV
jgi:extradiol dioxygenase family protein